MLSHNFWTACFVSKFGQLIIWEISLSTTAILYMWYIYFLPRAAVAPDPLKILRIPPSLEIVPIKPRNWKANKTYKVFLPHL